jgi:hypothetical protein
MNWVRVCLSLASHNDAQIGSCAYSALHLERAKETHVLGFSHCFRHIFSHIAGFEYGLLGEAHSFLQ